MLGREAGGDEAAAQRFLSRYAHPLPVHVGALPLLRDEQLVGRRVVDDAQDDLPLVRQRDGDDEEREAVHEVRRSVHRIHDPEVLGVAHALKSSGRRLWPRLHSFFPKKRMGGEIHHDEAADQLLRAFVHLGDEIMRRHLLVEPLVVSQLCLDPLARLGGAVDGHGGKTFAPDYRFVHPAHFFLFVSISKILRLQPVVYKVYDPHSDSVANGTGCRALRLRARSKGGPALPDEPRGQHEQRRAQQPHDAASAHAGCDPCAGLASRPCAGSEGKHEQPVDLPHGAMHAAAQNGRQENDEHGRRRRHMRRETEQNDHDGDEQRASSDAEQSRHESDQQADYEQQRQAVAVFVRRACAVGQPAGDRPFNCKRIHSVAQDEQHGHKQHEQAEAELKGAAMEPGSQRLADHRSRTAGDKEHPRAAEIDLALLGVRHRRRQRGHDEHGKRSADGRRLRYRRSRQALAEQQQDRHDDDASAKADNAAEYGSDNACKYDQDPFQHRYSLLLYPSNAACAAKARIPLRGSGWRFVPVHCSRPLHDLDRAAVQDTDSLSRRLEPAEMLHQRHQSLVLRLGFHHAVEQLHGAVHAAQEFQQRTRLHEVRMASRIAEALRTGDVDLRRQA
ncbi:hypothetical protein BN871_EK_00070 [Paenibacillus sp. P22]|nr:hypothetical protein BN871_EK_00070 [Paenibacillus sp. P22]